MKKLVLVLLLTAIPAISHANCLIVPGATIQFALTDDGVTWQITGENQKPVGAVVLSCKADPNDIDSWAAMASAIPQRGNTICEGETLTSPRPDLANCKISKVSSATK